MATRGRSTEGTSNFLMIYIIYERQQDQKSHLIVDITKDDYMDTNLGNKPNRFRAFLSYAHGDRARVEKIATALNELNILALWDKDIIAGKSFTEEIKDLIRRAHIFIPIITSNSNNRPWVHQETGFAIALDIPVLPIAIGNTPNEMISSLQAVVIDENLSNLVSELNKVDFEKIVLPVLRKPYGLIEIADTPLKRVEMIAEYANWVSAELKEYGIVRNQAKLSGFSVPNSVQDPKWIDRDGYDASAREFLRPAMTKERQALELHAKRAGCKLIIDPSVKTFNTSGPRVRQARLSILRDFLKNIPSNKISVVTSERAQDTNLIIVGDYFVAESMAPHQGSGYLQTIVNSHSPTVSRRIKAFDILFEELSAGQDTSKEAALYKIEQLLNTL